MAGAKTYYLNSGIVTGVQQGMSETSPGSDGSTSPNYGWTVGTTAAGNYASADAQTMVPAASFGATAQPDGSIVTTAAAGDSWRTNVPLSGTFTAGTWTFHCAIIQGGAGVGGVGHAEFRLFRSANADGSSATELTGGSNVIGGDATYSVVTQADSSGTASLSAITLTDEYLFVQLGWKIVTAPTGMSASTCAVIVRAGSTASRLVTPSFRQANGVTPVRESGACTNIADVDVDWLTPSEAQAADGGFSQFVNTVLFLEQFSDFLDAATFGLASDPNDLQDEDEVLGIRAQADAFTTIATGTSWDSVRLVIAGSVVGSDMSDASDLPTTIATKTWGGSTDTWGLSGLLGKDFKRTDTGFRVRCVAHPGLGAVGKVDQMRMTVYYKRSPKSGVALSGGASMSF